MFQINDQQTKQKIWLGQNVFHYWVTRSSSFEVRLLTGWRLRDIKMASPWQAQKGLIFVLVGVISLATDAQNPNPGAGQILKRFEYKYSFKPPYLAQKDGTVPFFEYSGSKWGKFIYRFFPKSSMVSDNLTDIFQSQIEDFFFYKINGH